MRNSVIVPATILVALSFTSAYADPVVGPATVFAAGSAVGATGPDSVTVGAGSVWVEWGNNADGQAGTGASTIVQYNQADGAIQSQYSVAGLVDGLRYNPVTSTVWALQNNDGNSTLSIINPTTHQVSGPLSYGPPYVYGPSSGRGYDDVAFQNGQVFLSYTNPSVASDPVLQRLNQGNNPTGTLTTTNILTAGQTGTLPDTDSLLATPSGGLVQTAEGDGPSSGSTGEFTLIRNPGTPSQTVSNVVVTDRSGNNVYSLDDVVFPGATAGTFYLTDASTNAIYALDVSGLDPNAALASIAGFNQPGGAMPSDVTIDPEIGIVGPDGVATPLITTANLPGPAFTVGAFVPAPVPEPAAGMLLATGVLALAGLTRYRRG